MGAIKTAADAAWRDHKIVGVASSGAHEPVKSEIRAVLHEIDAAIENTVANASFVFDSKSTMDATLAHPENTMAQVIGDGANDGVYRKIGASGSGSWAKTSAPTTGQIMTSVEDRASVGAAETRAPLDDDVAAAIVTQSGRYLLRADSYGRLTRSDDHRRSIAWIESGKAMVTDEYGRDVQLTDGTPAALVVEGLENGRALVRSDYPAFGSKALMIYGAASGSAPVLAGGVVLHLPIFGDSISNGSRATESYEQVGPDAYDAQTLMIKRVTGGGSGAGIDDVRVGQDNSSTSTIAPLSASALEGLTPLVERYGVASANGQSWASGLARALQVEAKAKVRAPHRFVFSAHGVGGAVYADISRGTTPYLNLLTAVTHVRDVAARWGEKSFVPTVLLSMGTNDVTMLTESGLNQFWTDLNTDIKAITGQVADLYLTLHQPSSFYDATSQIGPFDILAAARNNPARFSVANPHYAFHSLYPNSINDLIHLSARASRYQGEYMARVLRRRTLLGKQHGPATVTSVTGAGSSTLIVTVAVPTPPVVIDTITIAAVPGMGFRVRNPGNAIVAVTAASVTGAQEITLTLDAPAAASGAVLEYATAGHVVANGRQSTTIPRGNIRDSAPDVSVFDGTPLPNWLLHCKTAIS